MGRYSYPQLALMVLASTVVVTLFVAATTSSASLGAYNGDWDGTSNLRVTADSAGADVTVAENASVVSTVPANGTLTLALSPTGSARQAAVFRSVVRDGGTLLVAADYGTGGNDLLAGVGATARINGTPVRDEQRAGPSPAFPRAAPTRNHTYTADVETLVLNHGTVVQPGNATALFNTSEFSYLDTNGNEQLDETESLAERPVVTTESVGNGTVVVVSDPSIFLNAMQDQADNAAFVQALVTDHERIVLAGTESRSLPPLVRLQLFLRDAPVAVFVAGTLSILLILVFAEPNGPLARLRTRETATRPQLSHAELVAAIRERHPEWADERIERVTERLIRQRANNATDD